jgi:hypothetical protein
VNFNNIVFLTLTQKKGLRDFMYQFLDEVKDIFFKLYDQNIDNPRNDYRQFTDIIKKKMVFNLIHKK